MLVVDNKLNVEEFKLMVDKLNWLRLPRALNSNHKEFFYQGKYEDSQRIVKVIVRPSMWMSVSDSFKNRKPMDGSIPEETYKGPLVEWGYYTEAYVDEKFLAKIEQLAKEPGVRVNQVISWD